MNNTKPKKLRILNVVGARPNFAKMAPLYRMYRKNAGAIHPILVHTMQHSSKNMSDSFFRALGIPKPKYRLSPRQTSSNLLIADIISQLDGVLAKERPHLVVVVGDVNSSLAAAVAANKLGIPVAHVEAGLRSGDRNMPEEMNRIVIDHISDLLFVSEKSGLQNLKNEGIEKSRIFFTGNVMIDTLIKSLPKIRKTNILRRIGISPRRYAVITMHRPSNVDSKKSLLALLLLLEAVIAKTSLPFVFPVHPRTMKSIVKNGLLASYRKMPDLVLMDPLGYIDMMRLIKDSSFVLTDSGGIQEEAAYLKVPTITLRDSTERPSTIECGANRLHAMNDLPSLIKSIQTIIDEKKNPIRNIPLYDGRASERIVKIMLDKHRIS